MIKQLFSYHSESSKTADDRLQLIVLVIIRISLLVAIAWAVLTGNWETVGMSALTYASTYIPQLVEHQYRVYLPIEYHLVIVAFLYGSLFLGEVGDAYERFGWWDLMLHTSSGMVLGFIGFLTLYVLYLQQRLKMSALLIAFFSFCVALAGGAMWEIIEFSADQLFGAVMQNGNTDTMRDLIVDAVGAVVVAVAGYYHVKSARRGLIARHVNNFVALNPQLFKNSKDKTESL